MARLKALLLSDVHEWAFDQSMKDGEEYLRDEFDITHGYVWDFEIDGVPLPNMEDFDIVFAQYHWRSLESLLPWDRTVGALRARWLHPDRKEPAGKEDFDHVNRYQGYQVVTQANYAELIEHCPRVRYVTNPVNMRRFPKPSPVHAQLVASWNGNAGHSNKTHEDVKGFYSVILPACARVGIKLEFAEFNTRRLRPVKMPDFYQQADVALCASLYEGASSSVMEAMASGLAVIATDVGNHREMQEAQLKHFGETGIVLVERGIDSFVDALEDLLCQPPGQVKQMGELNRVEIEERWSWAAWRDRYAELLKLGLGRC